MSELNNITSPWVISESGDDVDILPDFNSPHSDAIASVFGVTREEQVNRARLMRAGPVLKDLLENVVIAFGMGWEMDGVIGMAKDHLETIELLVEPPYPPATEFQVRSRADFAKANGVLITMPTLDSARQFAIDHPERMADEIVEVTVDGGEERDGWKIHYIPQFESK